MMQAIVDTQEEILVKLSLYSRRAAPTKGRPEMYALAAQVRLLRQGRYHDHDYSTRLLAAWEYRLLFDALSPGREDGRPDCDRTLLNYPAENLFFTVTGDAFRDQAKWHGMTTAFVEPRALPAEVVRLLFRLLDGREVDDRAVISFFS